MQHLGAQCKRKARSGRGEPYSALFVHLAAATPAVRWLEHFPLLEPLFDDPVDMDANGEIAPSAALGHGLNWAEGARAEFLVIDKIE